MEPRKIMRNTSGGVDRAGYFRHGRGNRCTKTQVHAAPVIWHGWRGGDGEGHGWRWGTTRHETIWEGWKLI